MSTQPTDSRFDFNPSFASVDYTKYKDFYQYLGATVIVLILITIGAILFADIQPRINDIITGISGYLTNVYTEIISVVVTILILDRRAEKREAQRRANERDKEKQQHIEERNRRLVREIGSKDNATALNALREAQELNLLKGDNGILQDADLRGTSLSDMALPQLNLSKANLYGGDLSNMELQGASLSGANLGFVNLSGTKLFGANLSDTDLSFANLSKANLWDANLSGANLTQANLSNTNLYGGDLSYTELTRVDFRGTHLEEANLSGANLKDAKFTKSTLLPNGIYWTSETDMTRFIDPLHPNFWQPIWVRIGFNRWRDWDNVNRPNPDEPFQSWTIKFRNFHDWQKAGFPDLDLDEF